MVIHRKPFDCKRCTASFVRGDRLLAHSRIHTGEKPFKCHLCPRSFSRKDRLKTHIRYHNGETPHRCETCDKNFTQAAHLAKHMKVGTALFGGCPVYWVLRVPPPPAGVSYGGRKGLW